MQIYDLVATQLSILFYVAVMAYVYFYRGYVLLPATRQQQRDETSRAVVFDPWQQQQQSFDYGQRHDGGQANDWSYDMTSLTGPYDSSGIAYVQPRPNYMPDASMRQSYARPYPPPQPQPQSLSQPLTQPLSQSLSLPQQWRSPTSDYQHTLTRNYLGS
jgi:hypothetical protein